MSKYLMNKLIHLVNMDEQAEEKYTANPREFVEKWEKTQKLKLEPGRTRSAGDQGLRQALRARRAPVYSLEFHRSRLGPRKGRAKNWWPTTKAKAAKAGYPNFKT